MSQFIQVCEDDDTMDSIEIPSEDDGSLLLTTIAAQFPGACGLKYKSESGIFRGIRFADGVLFAPEGVWGSNQYFVVFPKTEKRKGDDGCFGNPASKLKRTTSDNSKCTDLIVLGLPWKSGEDDLRNYFSQFGDLVLVQVKRDLRTGQSKGFGFIRFCTMDAQIKCMSQRHMIDGRWCDVTIPNSKESGSRLNQSDNWQQLLASSNNEALNNAVNKKIFVGRCTENISTEDLRCYFSKFGEVVDVFIPKPFRAFAFVTFTDADLAQSLYGDDHIIKGTSVHISNASPKSYDKSGGPKSNFGSFGQQGGYSSQGQLAYSGGMNQVAKPNGDLPIPTTLGLDLLNSAMLVAAQAMLSGQSGFGGSGGPLGQPGSTPDQPNQNSNSSSAYTWGNADSVPPAASYPNWGPHYQRSSWN